MQNKNARGSASQYYVAAELNRRGFSADVSRGTTPMIDIWCGNTEGTKSITIQVKTFSGGKTCMVGSHAGKFTSTTLFWIIVDLPNKQSSKQPRYFIVPSKELKTVEELHQKWLNTLGKNGKPHKDSSVRCVYTCANEPSNDRFNISQFEERWDLIESALK